MAESSVLIARLRGIAPSSGREQPAVDDWLAHGLARGRLHELFAEEPDDASSAAGFAIALSLCAKALPILWLRTQGSERRAGLVHARGIAGLGLDAGSLMIGVVPDEAALIRAVADAARCTGLGTVLVEAWGRAPAIDLTCSRRLMLAAEGSGVTVLMLRIDAEPRASAAATRWSIGAGRSTALDANAPGAPCFEIELLRRRGGPAGLRWCVEWNHDQRRFLAAALSGAAFPMAADRSFASEPGAPVRRTA